MGWFKDTLAGKNNSQIAGAVIGGVLGGPAGAVAGAALGNKGNQKALKNAGGAILGTRDDAGILGTGQYKAGPAKIDETAFTAKSTARQKQLSEAMSRFGQRQAPTAQAASIDQSAANQSRGYQDQLAQALQGRVAGTGGPSLAEMQQRQGLNQALSNTLAQSASMRGVNPALALRMAQQSNAAAQQNAAFQGGMLRAQEQRDAESQLAGLSTSMRGQDLDVASQNAAMQQAINLANQQAALQQTTLNDAQVAAIRAQQLGLSEADRQAAMDLGKLRVQENVGLSTANAAAYGDAAKRRQGVIGGIAEAIGLSDRTAKKNVTSVSYSDRNLKTDIEPADNNKKLGMILGQGIGKLGKYMFGKGEGGSGLDSGLGSAASGAMMSDENEKSGISRAKAKKFADSIKAYTYEYKEPEKYGQGTQLGVMAQDLEKTPEGAMLVIDSPEGKMVDYGKSAPILMATQAMINDRLNGIEKALKAKKSMKGAA